MEDYILQEKLSILHQEKTPERTVHARGMVAKGHFEITHDISDVCCADVFKSKGKKTPVAARFSTVTHPKGSPESLRDVRGFSVKFYTSQGNWDFVGNNIPVFWIRDGMQFTDVVRATRPNPKTNIQEGWRVMDYLSHFPESANILTWLLDDNGIPANWRVLEGYSVNTYVMINKKGEETWVKMHWRPKGGAKFLTNEQAKEVGDANWRHSHATHDLYNTIELGDYPEWEFFIQTMNPADENNFYFDPLDCTKVWPEEQFPLRPVGKMVLDTNIDSFHAESEQIAFSPANVVPGITFSNDKLLQSRVFSYVDAQRYRIGINYEMLPINQPKCPFHNNHNDGQLNFMHKNEEVNYYPSSIDKKDKPAPASTSTMSQYDNTGPRVRCDYQMEQEEFRQPGERYRSFDDDRKGRFQTQVLKWMAEPKMNDEVRDTWLGYWSQVDASLGEDLKQKLPGMINDSHDAKRTNDTKVKTKESYAKNGVLV
jgi:catalase